MDGTDSRCLTLGRIRRQRLLRNYNLRIILQLVETAVGDDVSWIDARNRSVAGVGYPGLNIPDLCRVVLDEINKRGLAVVLNGGSRDQSDTLFGIEQKPGIHKLVGKQCIVLVIEKRPHLHGPSCGVDLIVEGKEFAGS